jgi:LPXTG-motif cell wall-anchored protein
VAQAPAEEQAPAVAQAPAAGQPTELASTGSNLLALAVIAALCLVGAALVFPRTRRRTTR